MQSLPGRAVAHTAGVREVEGERSGVEMPEPVVADGEPLFGFFTHVIQYTARVTNTVGYMSDATGKTKDAGWEVGVRTTVAAPVPAVWQYLVGDGLGTWLGDIDSLPTETGAGYVTKDGVKGTIRSRTENVRLRLSWQPSDWPHDSTLQLTVKETITGTTIGIRHEKLADRDERRMMLGHWKNIAAAFDQHFA